MGNANLTGANPNVKSPQVNLCSTGVWDKENNPNPTDGTTTTLKQDNAYIAVEQFCSDPDLYPDLNEELCSNIGDPSEWSVYESKIPNSCQYNNCNPGFTVQGGCNGKCCSIVGFSTSCARVSYNADPVVCCFNDYACDNSQEKCFQTPAQQRTCDPTFRNLSSTTCQKTIQDYCTGEKLFPSQSDWIEMWLEDSEIEINSSMELSTEVYPATIYSPEVIVKERGVRYPLPEKQPCLRAIARNVTDGQICTWDQLQAGEVVTGNLNPQGLAWSQGLISAVYNKYKAENGKGLLTGINTDGFSRDSGFYNTLWNICNKIPLLCTDGNQDTNQGILKDLCSNVTTETLSKNPNTIRWCACHMPESQYEEYQNKFGLSKECTPMCNRQGVLPAIDTDGEVKYCTQSLCMIDKNNLDITNSQFEGGITFNNVCSGCGNSNISRSFSQINQSSSTTTNTGSSKYILKNPPLQIAPGGDYFSVYGKAYNLTSITKSLTITSAYLTYDDWSSDNTAQSTPVNGETIPLIVEFGFVSIYNYNGIVNIEAIVPDGSNTDLSTKSIVITQTYDPSSGSFTPIPLDKGGVIAGSQGNMFLQKIKGKDFSAESVSHTTTKFNYGSATSNVSASTCSCVMDGVTLDAVNSLVTGGANFSNSCGQSSCVDSEGKPISCSDSTENPIPVNPILVLEKETAQIETRQKYSTIFYIMISIILFVIIFDILKAFLRKHH